MKLRRKLFSKKKISPRQLREKYGAFTNSDESAQALLRGANRQWKRYNDPQFQKNDFEERFNRVFKQDKGKNSE